MDIQKWLLGRKSPTYAPYYNGKMSYALHGKDWEKYVTEAFPDLARMQTSENVFKSVIDLYAENLVPQYDELRGFSNSLVPLLCRGEVPVVVDQAGEPHFPEQFEMVSDGRYTVAAIFTRSLEKMTDNVTFVHSDGRAELWSKPVPDDLEPADRENYKLVEETHGNKLIRFALDDRGFGASLAALQDRVNHSILDQTVVAEMYARPFWYLLNVELPPENPYLPAQAQPTGDAMKEQKSRGATGRIFTTSSQGPFGQLEPPTIQDMIAYHDSIIDKVSQSTGIPQHYFKPGQGTPPTGIALKVLSRRFNNKIARIRDDIKPQLEELAAAINLDKGEGNEEYEFWPESDDLLQDALDAHGIALSQMGYPLKYIAEVVTPGVDLEEYEEDHEEGDNPRAPGTDPTVVPQGPATQPGVQATPGQVMAYGQNPGQIARRDN